MRTLSMGGAAALLGASPGAAVLSRFGRAGGLGATAGAPDEEWNPLRRPEAVAPRDLTLHAAVGTADVGNGVEGTAWLLNGSLPSPLLRVRRGEPFELTLDNELPDSLILHWHGITPPEAMDGHPRLAIRTGETYDYRFQVENRAGTYWYHSHTHHRVGKHAYLGIAGMLIVEDEEEEALGLPSGEREIPIILQDRRVDERGAVLPYRDPDTLEGVIGNEPFGNGINRPRLEVDTALYRLRILNGSNARIFRLARNDGKDLVLIGNDNGLLDRPRRLEFIDLAPAERIDLLIDLRDAEVGDQILLGSRAFHIAGGLAGPQQEHRQGHPLELLQLAVTRRTRDRSAIPERLSTPPAGPDPAEAVRERSFTFSSDRDMHTRTMISHLINGKTFEMDRIDERVPFGETEIWTLSNENKFAHPMHLHGTHFRVLSRTGGRNRVMPWEKVGLKDTVLVYPEEEVRIAVRFDAHPGLFLLHCHNLEHEDVGMMLNVLVE